MAAPALERISEEKPRTRRTMLLGATMGIALIAGVHAIAAASQYQLKGLQQEYALRAAQCVGAEASLSKCIDGLKREWRYRGLFMIENEYRDNAQKCAALNSDNAQECILDLNSSPRYRAMLQRNPGLRIEYR